MLVVCDGRHYPVISSEELRNLHVQAITNSCQSWTCQDLELCMLATKYYWSWIKPDQAPYMFAVEFEGPGATVSWCSELE